MKHNVKIVVVENDARVRDLIVDILEFCVNREVTAFADADAAWRHLKHPHKAHVVLVETQLPGMCGDELIRRLKERDPDIVCVMMSGRKEDETRAEGLKADAFLAKPFVIDDLFEIVQRFVVDG